MIKKQIKKTKGKRSKRKFQQVDVVGDGNCLFRAISHCLYSTETKHQQLRELAIETMMKEKEFFKQQITQQLYEKKSESMGEAPILLAKEQLFDRYIELVRRDKCYGGQLEIQALAKELNIRINIKGLIPKTFLQVNQVGKNDIFLRLIQKLNEPNHYVSLIRKQDKN